MPLAEDLGCLVACGWKAVAPPDLVEAPRIASVPGNEVTTADPQPACDPNLDGIPLGQRARRLMGSRGEVRSRSDFQHDATRSDSPRADDPVVIPRTLLSIGLNYSMLMARMPGFLRTGPTAPSFDPVCQLA
jgi:hypothetical protein